MGIWSRLVAWAEKHNARFDPPPEEWSYFDKLYEKTGSFASYYFSKKPYPHQILNSDLQRYLGIFGAMGMPKERAVKCDFDYMGTPECEELYHQYFKTRIPRLGSIQSIAIYAGKGWAIAYFSYYEMDPKPQCRRLLRFAILDPVFAVQFRLTEA